MKLDNATRDGPLHLRKYLVAFRPDNSGANWETVAGQAIDQIRKLYDAGLVEMCQGHHRGHYQLYAIPRRMKSVERHYFSPDGRDFEMGGPR